MARKKACKKGELIRAVHLSEGQHDRCAEAEVEASVKKIYKIRSAFGRIDPLQSPDSQRGRFRIDGKAFDRLSKNAGAISPMASRAGYFDVVQRLVNPTFWLTVLLQHIAKHLLCRLYCGWNKSSRARI